jgi:succinate dehydrogenase / fumarate reductase cytochrome b subunit
MTTSHKRPLKNLYLPGIQLPVGGVVSILHRLSGILWVVSLPLMLWFLQQSLIDDSSYQRVSALFATLPIRLLSLILVMIVIHHLVAGLRHLLQDVEIGVTREGGSRGAWLVILTVAIASSVAGVWLFK